MLHDTAPIPGAVRRALARTATPALACPAGLAFLLLATPSVALSQVTVSVGASDDTASETSADNGAFVVRRVDGSLFESVTVNYSVAGSASPGDDYAPLPGSVTLGSLQTEASIPVEVAGDDGVFEGDETVVIQLLEDDGGSDDDDGNGGGVSVADGAATVTILDSEHAVTATSRSNATENPPADGLIDVSLGARNASGNPLTVEYSVAGTATPAVDYVALTGIAVIPVGSSAAAIDVTPLDDDLQEGAETVEITLTGTSDERAPVGSPASASVTIADDDEGSGNGDTDDDDDIVRVSVSASDDTAGEAPADDGEFLVRRVGGHPNRGVTVEYSVSGTATPGDDYAPLSGSVKLNGDEASIAVDVAGNDGVFEGDETVTITLREKQGEVGVDNGSATVTILDSDHAVTASRTSNASENPAGEGRISVSLGARNASGEALDVEYSVAGSATPGSDYATLNGVVTIADGSRSASIDIAPLDDEETEGDETVEITLTGTSDSRVAVGTPAVASVTIADDETGDDDDDGDDGDDGGGDGDDPVDPVDPADDPDGDGLSNEEERDLGTDPAVADTDGDGVDDGMEADAGTDPLDDRSFADADGDLVPDAVEAADETDPQDSQSFADGDGGGTADHIETLIYQSHGIPATDTADADDDRRDFDGDGLPDRLEISTGSDPDAADSPTANGGDDASGNGISNAVEEYLATLGINDVDAVSDRDRDGYPDAAEVSLGLDPLRASERDSDGDGVPDAVEALAGLDIDGATDSDGDGVPDAREIGLGSDPLDANSPVANGAMDDDGDGISNAIEEVLQRLGASEDPDEDSDEDDDGIGDADEIRRGTDPLHDEQPAPWVELRQAEIGRVNALVTDGGTATATAIIGGHQGGTLSYDWSGSDNAILAVVSGGRSDRTLTIAPQTLPPGPYNLVVSVERAAGDYRSEVSTVEFTVNVLSEAGAAEIADADNDGVPDFSDDADARSGFGNELQASSGARMQAEEGLRLQLGSTARIARTGTARVTQSDIASAGNGSGGSVGGSEDEFDYVSGIYDFEVTNLPEVGSTVQVVIPQATAIAEFPEYRKFQPGSGWSNFVENDSNSLASAAGDAGSCPPPGDDSYQSGLRSGHSCIRLGIEDGGPNDGDAELGPNGVVKDPGGVATPKGEVEVGEGGGALNPLAPLALAMAAALAALRRSARRAWRRPAEHGGSGA